MAAESSRVIARFRRREARARCSSRRRAARHEPSGVNALRRVARSLEAMRGSLRGDVLMVAGKSEALERNQRFIAQRLNRGWSDERLAALRRAAGAVDAGIASSRTGRLIECAFASARGPVYSSTFTTSAAGIPFSLCADTREAPHSLQRSGNAGARPARRDPRNA